MNPRRLILVFVLGAAAVLVACGGSDDTTPSPTDGLQVERTSLGDPGAPLQIVHWGNFR